MFDFAGLLSMFGGRRGRPGIHGKDGAEGYPGPEGPQGPQGAPGPRGRGNAGRTGPVGDTGPRGEGGERGLLGHRGIPGPAGDTGAKGEPGAPGGSLIVDAQGENAIIRVPLDVVVMETNREPWAELLAVRRKLARVVRFYKGLDIEIRPRIHIARHGKALLTFEGYDSAPMVKLHYGNPYGFLTCYIGVDAETIGKDGAGWVGQVSYKSGPWGAFIVAGSYPLAITRSEGANQMEQIIIHELGHYFLEGDGRDHEAGTFMDENISASESYTPAQAAALRSGAWGWGY